MGKPVGEGGRGEGAGYEWGGRNRRKGDRRIEVRIKVGLVQNETWEGPPAGQALHPPEETFIKEDLGLKHTAKCGGNNI